MLVYIVPETNEIIRVTIKASEDDMADIESKSPDVINPLGEPLNKRRVQLLSLYELKNYYFNKDK